jgi:hypothetical protein
MNGIVIIFPIFQFQNFDNFNHFKILINKKKIPFFWVPTLQKIAKIIVGYEII